MDVIKTEREVTQKVVDISYKAIDGTIFYDQEECTRYEETAEAVLLAKLKAIEITEISTDDLFESSGEGVYRVIVPTEQSHLDTLNQLWKLNGGASRDSLLFTEEDLKKVILVGIRMTENYKIDWMWFWKLNDVVKKVTNNKYRVVKSN